MTRTMQASFLTLLLLGLALGAPARAVAGLEVDCVEAGYDLYTLGRPFIDVASVSEDAVISPLAGGTFLNIPVVGVPLGTFDFGSGLVGVGDADTIVQRLDLADESSPTVDIEIVAMSLRSASPLPAAQTGQATDGHVYFNLSSPPSSSSNYNFEFFGVGSNPAGVYQPFFDLNYEARFGAPDGPIISLVDAPDSDGQLDLFPSGSVAWQHQPAPSGPTGPDRVIPDVNLNLHAGTQDADFFLDQFNTLTMLSSVTGESHTVLEFTMADGGLGDNSGNTPDDPILPLDPPTDGTFDFQDVPGDGNWFDPPAASGFHFETDGLSNFVSVIPPPLSSVPDASGDYVITSIEGSVTVAAGAIHTFGPGGVQEFTVTDINPTVDGGDPFAFPTFLLFDQPTVSFTMTPIPEPASGCVLLVASAIAAVGRRRK